MQAHYFPLLGRFLWVYIALIVVVGGITGALGIANAGTSLVPIMVAAMDGGGRFVKRAKRAPTSGEKWVLAAMHSLVSVLVAIPILVLMAALAPELLSGVGALIILAIVVGAFLFNVLVCRVFVWLGARNMVKKMGPQIGDAEVFQ
ncbi:MAG: ABZJ_00895 family protein [Pseudomonadota bacterium]